MSENMITWQHAEEAGREDEHHYERYSAHSLQQAVDSLISNSRCGKPTPINIGLSVSTFAAKSSDELRR